MYRPSPDPYDKAPPPDADPREIEAWALLKAARRLDRARTDPENAQEIRDSLRQNQMLWTIFQTAVAAADCPLPRDVRESILNLSVFVDKRTYSCLSDLDPGKIPALVGINRNIAMGLMERGADAPAATPKSQAPETTAEQPKKPATFNFNI